MVIMVTLDWCGEQRRGIRLVKPNPNLANAYLETASETLDVLALIEGTSTVWLATTKYYCEYFATYAYLIAVGITCEIHDCTILVAERLAAAGLLPLGIADSLRKDKQRRIENQYYLQNKDVAVDHGAMLSFLLEMKERVLHLTDEQRAQARAEVTA